MHRLLTELTGAEAALVVNNNAGALLLVLMALANERDALVLVPSNKSELAMGYSTLYGDMVGALAPIADVYKKSRDAALEQVRGWGINHIDTAASYGASEDRLQGWLGRHRNEVFLATKTGERRGSAARAELERSLERMAVDHVDLIQLHNLVEDDEWETAFAPGGAVEALAAARTHAPTKAVVDLKLEESSGLDLVPELKALVPGMVIVILTGYASIATTVTAIKRGAADYLPKPAGVDEVVRALTGANAKQPESDEYNPLSVERLEWEHIQKVLQENDGNISATARSLGMYRRTLQRKLAKKPRGD